MMWLTALSLALSIGAVDKHTVKRIQNVYQQHQTLSGSFTQDTYIALLEENRPSKGKFAFQKPGKLRWVYQGKPGKAKKYYISDSKTLWIYDARANQLSETSDTQRVTDKLAVDFLWGLGRIEKDFTLQELTLEEVKLFKQKAKKQIRFKLTPKKRQGSITSFIVSLDPKSLKLEELVLFNRNMNRVHYQFSKIRMGKKINAEQFNIVSVKVPKNAERIKLP